MKPLGYSIEEIRELLGALDTLADAPTSAGRLDEASDTLRRFLTRTEQRVRDLRAQIAKAEDFARMVDVLLDGPDGAPRRRDDPGEPKS